jgi:hypothetical protein
MQKRIDEFDTSYLPRDVPTTLRSWLDILDDVDEHDDWLYLEKEFQQWLTLPYEGLEGRPDYWKAGYIWGIKRVVEAQHGGTRAVHTWLRDVLRRIAALSERAC